ncbi:MAG: response regulator [Pseudomonadota bacterium]
MEVRTKAIEPFFSTRTAEGGTGLGLSIVYGFIKQSGGNLEIDSDEGKGTTISITMPLADPEYIETGSRPNKTALVIDDDQQVRRIVDAILREMNFNSTLCSTASDAMRYLESGKFELIVSDFDLGSDVTGHDILETSTKILPEAKRILISGKSSISKDYDGPDVMVQKPITAKKLKLALDC